jgi:predicted small metal-binding protein
MIGPIKTTTDTVQPNLLLRVFMKNSLSCRDLGDNLCSFEAKSKNCAELIDKMLNHIEKLHSEKIANLSIEERSEMAAKLELKIK